MTPGTRVATPIGPGIVVETLRTGLSVEAVAVALKAGGKPILFLASHVEPMSARVIPFPPRPGSRPCDTEPPEAA